MFGFTTPSELPDKACHWGDPVAGRRVGPDHAVEFPAGDPPWKVTPALVCCTAVVLKPSSDAPSLPAALTQVSAEAGLPPGVLNLVPGDIAAVGRRSSASRRALISFTGSPPSAPPSTPSRPVVQAFPLELGGKNAMLVLADAASTWRSRRASRGVRPVRHAAPPPPV